MASEATKETDDVETTAQEIQFSPKDDGTIYFVEKLGQSGPALVFQDVTGKREGYNVFELSGTNLQLSDMGNSIDGVIGDIHPKGQVEVIEGRRHGIKPDEQMSEFIRCGDGEYLVRLTWREAFELGLYKSAVLPLLGTGDTTMTAVPEAVASDKTDVTMMPETTLGGRRKRSSCRRRSSRRRRSRRRKTRLGGRSRRRRSRRRRRTRRKSRRRRRYRRSRRRRR